MQRELNSKTYIQYKCSIIMMVITINLKVVTHQYNTSLKNVSESQLILTSAIRYIDSSNGTLKRLLAEVDALCSDLTEDIQSTEQPEPPISKCSLLEQVEQQNKLRETGKPNSPVK